MRLNLRTTFLRFALISLIAGCRDAVSPNPSAAISVSVRVTGVFPSDRFEIQLDGHSMTLLVSETSLVVRSLSAGTHTVSLVGLPANCRSEELNPARVETAPANMSTIEFHVTCTALTGAIAVAVTVAGNDVSQWFQAQVDTLTPRASVRGNATTVFPGSFSRGTHVVRLSAVPGNCQPTGDLLAAVNVKTGAIALDTAVASFSFKCEASNPSSDTTTAIVFERNGYIMLLGKDSALRLTEGQKPSWSPDGRLISFQRLNYCDSQTVCEHDLWYTTAAGGDPKSAQKDANMDDFDVSISPDGASIAFVRIWLGPDQSYLAISSLSGGPARLLSMWHPYAATSWSPDASRIAFVCQGPVTSLDLCVARTDSFCTTYFSNTCNWPVPLHLTETAGPGDELDPAWSPDGRRIAFTLSCQTGTGQMAPSQIPCPANVTPGNPYVAVLDVASRAITRLVPGHDPAWSPDGSQLVFVGNAGSPGLRVYNMTDGSMRQLTDNPADTSPSWR